MGEILALIATFFFAFAYVVRKWQTADLNNYEITQLMFVFAFVTVFIASLIKGEGIPTQHWTLGFVIPLLLSGLSNVFNVFLTNYGFQKVNVVLASNLLTLESAFAIGFGYFFYNEIPTLIALIGGIIIVVSAIGINTLEGEENKEKSFLKKFFSKSKVPINPAEITS